jgi:ubiquinone/menaquinone biosynthesis C-methylase UbiE
MIHWHPADRKYSLAWNTQVQPALLECAKINLSWPQVNTLSDSLEFTGERFTPECEREIWYEHFHRYALATRWCANKRTLDAACGEGYGSALLARRADSVEGVDISEQAITHARQRYGQLQAVKFQVADCTRLPFADDEFERVVSFETLEHLDAHDELLAEFRRVLKPDGFLILSSPDKATYSDGQNTVNEYHVKELYRNEFEDLTRRYFPASRLLGQKLMFHSAIWSMDGVDQVMLDQASTNKIRNLETIAQAPMYFVALCAAEPAFLPDLDGTLWLFDDFEESVYQHYHGEIKRNMAAGGIIAGLEQEIENLKMSATQAVSKQGSWWQRFLRKT